MTSLRALLSDLPLADAASRDAVHERAANILRPSGALAWLDEIAAWVAAWQRTETPRVERPAGLIFAAELAHTMGRIDRARVAEHRHVVAGEYDLSLQPPPGLDTSALLALMHRDKKALDGLTFVLDGPDGVEVVVTYDRSLRRHHPCPPFCY